jgi:hypothetical protein
LKTTFIVSRSPLLSLLPFMIAATLLLNLS